MNGSAALRLSALGALVASALYVHLRGKVRLSLRRQVTDHSTFLAPFNALMYLFSAVPTKPILDVKDFPELAKLRDNWRTIRDEALKLYEIGHIRAADKHNDIAFNTFFQRGWKRFYLKWYDEFLPSAADLCPKTVELVRSLPNVNAALFALLPSGGKLAEHRDPFAGSLRYHLGLVTPNSEKCKIFIDGEPYVWRDGEDVLFDETYIHRAHNNTGETRIILFCDVERPLRTPVMRALNRFVIRHVAKITAGQNLPTEKVGFVNHLSKGVHRTRNFLRRMKGINRPAYYAVKYLLMIAALYFVVRAGFH
jgi:beta-hydroxylase